MSDYNHIHTSRLSAAWLVGADGVPLGLVGPADQLIRVVSVDEASQALSAGGSAFHDVGATRLETTGGQVTPDLAAGASLFIVDLDRDVVVNQPIFYAGGEDQNYSFRILFRQDATGGRTVTWNGWSIDGYLPEMPAEPFGWMCVTANSDRGGRAPVLEGLPATPVLAWASRPSATNRRGQEVFFYDLGRRGLTLVSDGLRWRPRDGSAVLGMLAADAAVAPNSAAVAVPETAVLAPAGLLQAGDVIGISFSLEKSGTAETFTHVVRAGSSVDVAAAAIHSPAALAAASRTRGFQGNFRVEAGGASLRKIGRGGAAEATPYAGDSSNIGAAIAVPNVLSNPLYFFLSVAGASSTETTTVREFSVTWMPA